MIRNFTLLLFYSCLLVMPTFGQKKQPIEYKIQIALLLDVSGSMTGLITQAKGQIWRMVNELNKAEKNNTQPIIEIAIGSFGNDVYANNGFFKLHSHLTSEIEIISENLFDLKTNGNNEYCGYAIQQTLDSLNWSNNKDDLKIIFIAGNEFFNQGTVDYTIVCRKAAKKKIKINTIYCGAEEVGRTHLWENAAILGKGKYLFIDQDSNSKYIETFWDKKIIELNTLLNKTYVPYGAIGEKNIQRQIKQDENAQLLGNNFVRERTKFKASNNYVNAHWDLIDAYQADNSILANVSSTDLPSDLQTMDAKKKKQYIEQKLRERNTYKESITMYCTKADDFIKAQNENEDVSFTLDNSIIQTIKEQGEKKGYIFK